MLRSSEGGGRAKLRSAKGSPPTRTGGPFATRQLLSCAQKPRHSGVRADGTARPSHPDGDGDGRGRGPRREDRARPLTTPGRPSSVRRFPLFLEVGTSEGECDVMRESDVFYVRMAMRLGGVDGGNSL